MDILLKELADSLKTDRKLIPFFKRVMVFVYITEKSDWWLEKTNLCYRSKSI